jgi:hypothetical protein
MAIGAAGDLQLVHRCGLQALDGLDADDALVLGLVRQHRRAGDVADGVDARHVGAAVAVDDDVPRSVFTPSFSRPRFSMLPTTPTAEITGRR